MASGLAIIASNVGAVDLLVSNKNGYLLALTELNSLAPIIEKFIEMPAEDIDSMKRNSFDIIKNSFLWSNIAQLHLNFFNDAIKKY